MNSCSTRQQFPDVNPGVVLTASVLIAALKSETVKGSASEYDTLQQLAAADRGAGLQQALDQLNQLGRDPQRPVAHFLARFEKYLRCDPGSYFPAQPGGQVGRGTRAINGNAETANLTNVRTMLVQLTDLARLEAGQESLEVEEFDASQTMRELVESAQPLAREKNLVLRADGPETLMVQNDAVKIQRIVQNLLLNAIRYTAEGHGVGVLVVGGRPPLAHQRPGLGAGTATGRGFQVSHATRA